MTDFFRFPHTPHLAWLGTGRPREDKVLGKAEAELLLAGNVTIEEKVDGANLGLSIESGRVRGQNRGEWLRPGHEHPQFRPLWGWLATREALLVERVPRQCIVFGEWCYARHSIAYTRLPDWFLVFDVYDRDTERFWTFEHREHLVGTLDLASVPRLGIGRYTLAGVQAMLGPSKLTDGPMEGLVVRRDDAEQQVARAKLVQPAFTQAMDDHWMRRALEPNRLSKAQQAPTEGS